MPKLCQFENCRNRASYAENYGNPIRCKTHKDNLKPQYGVCHCGNVRPYFNFEGLKPEYCSKCKKDDMINVKNNKCKCSLAIPCFNFEGLKPEYCSTCKLENMFDVVHNKCKCMQSRPSFNFEGLKAEYCVTCKMDGMIDVVHNKCNCKKSIPSFNFEGLKPEYCSICKLDTMIDVINKKCKCKKFRPCFNFKGLKPEYCSVCKLEDMIDVIHDKCKSSYCLGTTANIKYKGYCASCYQKLFPNDPLTFQIRSKTKEIAVRDFINNKFEGFHHDTPLWTGNCDCVNRRRIDHRKLIGNTLLCIETDENQHKRYDLKDEDIRYDDLFMVHGGKFIFIRFNPDKYKNKKGKSVNPMLYTRLPVLQKEIEKQIERIHKEENTELLEIVKLYYDNYN